LKKPAQASIYMRYVFKKKLLLAAVLFIDSVGYFIKALTRLFFRRRLRPGTGKILLLRLDHIGDVVMSSSVLTPLRENFPDSRIDMLLPGVSAELLQRHNALDSVLVFDAPWFKRGPEKAFFPIKKVLELAGIIRDGGYDIVVDLRGDLRHIAAMALSGTPRRIGYGITGGGFFLTDCPVYERELHEAQLDLRLLSPLGIRKSGAKPEFALSEDHIRQARDIKQRKGVFGDYAVIHPVPGDNDKSWSAENFAEITRYLRDIKRFLPVFVGTAGDIDTVHRITATCGGGTVNLAGELSLGGSAAVISEAALFVGVDSGPAHIAGAASVPSVVLFSGTNESRRWAPRGKNVVTVSAGEGREMSLLTPDRVCSCINEVLSGASTEAEVGNEDRN
jgi:ADP-heptose:LPS heptosyltransferase